MTRIDYVIGLTKYSGPASYPKNIGILPGILWDLLILVMLVNLKSYLIMTGQWHYVRTDRDIHSMPKFKSKYNSKTDREKKEEADESLIWQEQYPTLTGWGRFKFRASRTWQTISDFFYKLQPRYMDRI